MAKNQFQRLTYTSVFQQIDPVIVTLVANAAAAEILTLDVTPIKTLSVTMNITDAALTGLEVWARTDSNGRWFLIPVDQMDGYGRTDAGIDIATTPVGEACFIQINCVGWSDIQIRAKSLGAAKISISAGGQ